MHHGDEAEHEAEETATTNDEERTDRDVGGPTSGDTEGEDVTGSGTGTRDSEFDPHE
jgi:hypothetical protein